jgi:hypothetical protein
MVADIFDSGDELTSRTSPSPAFCSEAEWAAPRKVANDKTTIFAMAPVDFRKLAGLSIIHLTFSILIRRAAVPCAAVAGLSRYHLTIPGRLDILLRVPTVW